MIRVTVRALVCVAVLLIVAGSATAQVRVKTLGGGRATARGADAGFVDGNTLQSSQFNFPFGVAVDAVGNLFVADRNNGAIRKLDIAGNRVSAVLSGLNQPVAVAFDKTNNLYVVTQGDGAVRRLDAFGATANVTTGLSQPTALAIDQDKLYVTESAGHVVKVDLATLRATRVVENLNQPGGIAVLDSGLLAVAETGGNKVRLLDPATGATILQIGTGSAGFRNGPASVAQFKQPYHIAKAPNGTLVLADRGNHRVRLISPSGDVTTLYGIDPSLWEGPECIECTPIILPGWLDGSAEFAEARDPVGVTVSRDGKVYATEVFYHLVREITGASLTGGGTGTGGGGTTPNLTVLPPVFTPESGYFPLGQDINVVNPNTNAFFSTAIYYATDGTNPTTNSTRLPMNGGIGTIPWRETLRDLTSLRVVAIVGGVPSEIVSGKASTRNEIGITRDVAAGPGSTVIVPVTLNLAPNTQIKSLQFRVEIAPLGGATPMISDQFRALSISTNDFIHVATTTQLDKPALFNVAGYTNGIARGLAVTFIGPTANLVFEDFAVAALLAVPMPPNAPLGSRYSITVISPSGTSDASETSVPIFPMIAREIKVTETGYVVGDSAPATWYNADAVTTQAGPATQFGPYGFGDRQLSNNDVNNAFIASVGLRVPFPFSDLFDALDAFPEDSASAVGGDGLIRFLDWQIILRRSLGLDTAHWERKWTAGGVRVAAKSQAVRLASFAAKASSEAANSEVWQPQVALTATAVENAQPGATVEIPVSLAIGTGSRVGGLAFRATLLNAGAASALAEPLQFVPAPGVPAPVQSPGPANSILLCGWPLVPSPSFNPALQGRVLLGSMRFKVPVDAQRGQFFTLQFANADGSPDLQTQYDFETHSASVWIQTAKQQSAEIISDEWKTHFFGSAAVAIANAAADPDRDGVPNWMEYLAGTSPADSRSYLHLEPPALDKVKNQLVLRWLSARGKRYTIEARSDASLNWTALASDILGNGGMQQWIHPNPGAARLYRIRVNPEFLDLQ